MAKTIHALCVDSSSYLEILSLSDFQTTFSFLTSASALLAPLSIQLYILVLASVTFLDLLLF